MPKENGTASFKRLLLRLRPLLRFLQSFRGSPRAIAGGFSLGLFLALTPTIGVQLVIAVFLATLFKVSRPAALLSVMVTNPLTIAPIFTFNYWVGSLFITGPSVGEVYGRFIYIAAQMAKLNVWEVSAQVQMLAQTGHDMLIPLILGSFLVATFSAVLSYIVLLRFLKFVKLHKERKKLLLKHRQESLEGEED